jgi:hypothetical protein
MQRAASDIGRLFFVAIRLNFFVATRLNRLDQAPLLLTWPADGAVLLHENARLREVHPSHLTSCRVCSAVSRPGCCQASCPCPGRHWHRCHRRRRTASARIRPNGTSDGRRRAGRGRTCRRIALVEPRPLGPPLFEPACANASVLDRASRPAGAIDEELGSSCHPYRELNRSQLVCSGDPPIWQKPTPDMYRRGTSTSDTLLN